MSKLLSLAAILGLAALTQTADAAPSKTFMGQPIKIGFARPMIQQPMMQRHVFVKPIVVKPIFAQPVMHKPIFKPVIIKHVIASGYGHSGYHGSGYGHSGYNGSGYHAGGYKPVQPMYRYYPMTAYSYDTAPKFCSVMLYKSSYGMVKKVWRCEVMEKADYAPVQVIEKAPIEPTKIIERVIEKQIIEKQTIEKQVPLTEEVLPPK